MKRSKDYMLCHISGIPYLLPFGQGIADHRRGIKINETGVYLWELLKRDCTEDMLVSKCASHFHADSALLPGLRKDIQQFLNILQAHGIVESSQAKPDSPVSFYRQIKIGGLLLELSGPASAFSDFFLPFAVQKCENVHQRIRVLCRMPAKHPNGAVLLRSSDLVVMEGEAEYIFLFPALRHIWEARMTRDGSLMTFYCRPPFTDAFRENLFHAIRLGFLYLSQRHHMAVIHSASLLYQGRAWLFAAPSGTGKSTHTGLWNQVLQAPLINGDLNLLAMDGETPFVHGLPWCGTSGISNTGSYPLGGIILLRQAEKNYVEALSEDRKQLLVMQRFISPAWSKKQQEANLSFAGRLLPHIFICRLHCTKEVSAVYVIKQAIDSYLEMQIEN